MSDLIKDSMMLRAIIMDHYKFPHHHGLVEDETYAKKHMSSASCIDDIHVQAKIVDGVIEDICFDGVACTISTASTSIMCDLLVGKTVNEAKEIMNEYNKMIDGQPFDEDLLEEAICFHGVGKQANRIKCATIGWRGLDEILTESEGDSHE